jgi:general secretion pathway protein D
LAGVRVIRLQHANAKQIAEVMRSLVSNDGGSSTKAAAGGAASSTSSAGGVSLIADESQNALVIKADPSLNA